MLNPTALVAPSTHPAAIWPHDDTWVLNTTHRVAPGTHPHRGRPLMAVERPRLTARSVLASTLLGVSPPVLPTRVLVATAELLGVKPGAARVALSRMAAAGEVDATDDGYRLIGRLATRQARQDLSRHGPPAEWDGTWSTHVVTGEARPAGERADLRAALGALRHAELREGVWLRPANLPDGILPDAERLVSTSTTHLSSTVNEPGDLAARLWDLDGWARRGDRLHDALEDIRPALEDGDHEVLADAFLLLAGVLRHLQADPLLPLQLRPDGWPGNPLRTAHGLADGAFKRTLANWQRARR